jgi:L-alanine-DL-glutamate epimerase-like enolase superfamily enzyme
MVAGIALTAVPLRLETRHPFRISRGGTGEFQSVLVALHWNGLTGYGEAASSTYFGETTGTVLAALDAYRPLLAESTASPFQLERLLTDCTTRLRRNPAAHAAVDAALHDLLGKALDAPVRSLLGLQGLDHPFTSLTIGIDTPEIMARKVKEAAGWKALKIKVGFPGDVEVVQEIRHITQQTLRVDANAAWTPREAVTRARALAQLGVEMIEQPVAPEDVAGLRFVRERVDVPIYADESVETAADLPRLQGAVDGVNIKLAKCGGVREMLRMIHTARSLGLRVMLGCMIETSVGVTAAAQLACLADVLDLDGSSLLARDPTHGMEVDRGTITLPDAPGLGVTPLDRDLARALSQLTPTSSEVRRKERGRQATA